MLTHLLFGKTPHRLLEGIQAQDDYGSGRANIQSKTAEDLEGGKETKRSIEPKGHTEVLAEYKPQMEQMNEGSVDESNPRMAPLPISEGTADEGNREPQGPTDLTGGTFSGPNSRDRMDHLYPRPLPDSWKADYVEKQAHEHHLHPPPCPTWWSSTPGLSKPEMSDQERAQQLHTPPWEEKCDGEWGYEGFAQKAGRPSGPGQGQEGSHQDRGEDDFLKRCHAFSESVAYVHAFGNTHPTAAFTLGVNNMSDWTSEERRYLGGSRAVPVDTEKMLDLDNITLVEALVSGTISYDDAFNVSALSEISADDVERKHRRVVHHRRLPFSSSASNLSDVALPASLDYRYSDANPYGVVAVTSVKYQGTCGRYVDIKVNSPSPVSQYPPFQLCLLPQTSLCSNMHPHSRVPRIHFPTVVGHMLPVPLSRVKLLCSMPKISGTVIMISPPRTAALATAPTLCSQEASLPSNSLTAPTRTRGVKAGP